MADFQVSNSQPETGSPLLVTGATGNVGNAVLHHLSQSGETVRAAIRKPGEKTSLPPGTETVPLDFERPETFGQALRNVRGVFLMRPPLIVRVGHTLNRFIDVAAHEGVKHIVFLSVAGAGGNVLIPHTRVEHCLRESPLLWTILRPGFFAQNFTGAYLRDIHAGRIVLPAGEGRVAFVDALDIGEVAALALKNPVAHARKTYHLTGPAAVTFGEASNMLSSALGRPIGYEAASLSRYWKHTRSQQMEISRRIVLAMLHVGLRRDQAATVDPTMEGLLGKPTRTLEQFIDENLATLRP